MIKEKGKLILTAKAPLHNKEHYAHYSTIPVIHIPIRTNLTSLHHSCILAT